ncbi:hypothetical protein ACK324_22750, partial [Aeromonas dhakensis]
HGNFCAVGYHNPKREKVSGPMGSNPQTLWGGHRLMNMFSDDYQPADPDQFGKIEGNRELI